MRGTVAVLLCALAFQGCARSLEDLLPFPCPGDRRCPDKALCTLSSQCVSAALDVSCGSDFTASAGDGCLELPDKTCATCIRGVIVPPCTKTGTCDSSERECVHWADGTTGCSLKCAAAGCPAGLRCEHVGASDICLPTGVDTDGDGTGLHAELFSTGVLTSPVGETTIGPVDLSNYALPGGQTDGISLRLSGTLRAKYTGSHTLTVKTDDGTRVFLDGTKILDAWWGQAATDYTSEALQLEAGKRYPLVIEHYNYNGPERLRLSWTTPVSTRATVIPKEQLYP